MNISELFYHAALINAFIFFWLACAISTTRIFISLKNKVSFALIIGALLGPIGLILAWIYKLKSKKQKISNIRSYISIITVYLFVNFFFYWFFIQNSEEIFLSSEKFIDYLAIFSVILGAISGVALAAITRRVAFYESAWVTFFSTFSLLFLKDWANNVFSLGTSSAYFITVITSSSVLLLLFLTLGGALGYLIFGEGRLNLKFNYEGFISVRFLMAKRSNQVISLITIISVLAVTFACAGMVIVMSVMNGFSSDIRTKILGANPHLMLFKYGNDFTEYKSLIEKTKSIEGIKNVNPFILNEGIATSNKNTSGALITGIDVDLSSKSKKLIKYISKSALEKLKDPAKIEIPLDIDLFSDEEKLTNKTPPKNILPGIILGKEMAIQLQVFEGDTVNLVNPLGDIGPTGIIPKAKIFRVAGFFYSGMHEYDARFVYISLSDAQDFFGLKNSITGLEYVLSDVEQTKKIAKKVDSAVGGYPYYTRDWIQMNRPMFSALQLEKIAMLIILGTLILMSSLLILVTLIMVVMEKGKEIAILKSMGATDVSIMKIFVSYGLLVGGLGAFLGGFIGLFVCNVLDKIGIRLDPDIYYISHLPIKVDNMEVFLVVFSALLISFLATIPPSLFAARLRPVDGLRYE